MPRVAAARGLEESQGDDLVEALVQGRDRGIPGEARVKRGRLRVLLGAAPGVGKTYAMLEEGRRLRAAGKDVVIAVVETHGRAGTASMTAGFEIVPRLRIRHRGVELEEMDLGAVLARAPQIALVDELAHTNAPGLAHEKRWSDVEALLDAGIDVLSTVNIQHIESLNDVVQAITGVPQRETIPDAVLRSADQIEVVDLAPQALRDRLAEGQVYPAARVDAALSNYFRLGNLTALRELALLWLADEVDSSLQRYRAEHGIGDKWEARERVVVALTGGPEGETLLRRGARIAARSAGGRLLAVHVTAQDGLREPNPGALEAQRMLVESLGGSFHQVVGDDIPSALVEFARSSDATQLVIGVSRRSRVAALVTGPGIGATVIRESGDIDVHIVTHAAAGGRLRVPLPGVGGSLSVRRRVYGFGFAVVAGPLLTWLLTALRSEQSITTEVLSYQLLVVVAALIGGIWPALFAAVLSGFTLDFFFVAPLYTVTVADPLHLVALLLYVVIAVLVSIVVDQAARRSRRARRSAAEAELVATVAGSVLRGEDALQALVTQTREAFGLVSVRLVRAGRVLAEAGAVPGAPASAPSSPPAPAPSSPPELLASRQKASQNRAERADSGESRGGGAGVVSVGVDDETALELRGRALQASDRRLLAVIVVQIAAALEHANLEETAREMAPLAAADRVRSALLAAVGHDLRRPLAAATAAVTGLRADSASSTASRGRPAPRGTAASDGRATVTGDAPAAGGRGVGGPGAGGPGVGEPGMGGPGAGGLGAGELSAGELSAGGLGVGEPGAGGLGAGELGAGELSAGELSAGERDELLATAEESLATLAQLLTDLLDVSRLQAGVLGVSLAPVAFDDVLPAVLDELGLGPEQVDLDVPGALPEFLADPVLLDRVLVNLLSNALRYTPEGERVLVTASAFAGSVQLRVVDRGPGIPPERRDEVFVPFQRLGDTDNLTGLGLGLALSKGFVEGMGGTLDAEDTPGGGLTMVVTLPVAAPAAPSAPDAATPTAPTAPASPPAPTPPHEGTAP
ncbi:ATP-binding protein [Herbiconiux sp. 11R-BC]|uniref:sensor histidine kinase n=1 Tax=Herbiconiux sp. 11R-BC TaxID=3111637 RepID=UPI003C2DB46A